MELHDQAEMSAECVAVIVESILSEASDSLLFSADLACRGRCHRWERSQSSAWPNLTRNTRPRACIVGCHRLRRAARRPPSLRASTPLLCGLLAAIMLGALMVELSPSSSSTLQDEGRSV